MKGLSTARFAGIAAEIARISTQVCGDSCTAIALAGVPATGGKSEKSAESYLHSVEAQIALMRSELASGRQ